MVENGARSGSRTRILYRGTDFKSVASAIPPSGPKKQSVKLHHITNIFHCGTAKKTKILHARLSENSLEDVFENKTSQFIGTVCDEQFAFRGHIGSDYYFTGDFVIFVIFDIVQQHPDYRCGNVFG